MNKLPQDVSESTRRRNPLLYPALGGLGTDKPKPVTSQALVSNGQKLKTRKGGLAIVVTLVAYRRKLLDSHDNARSACKPLVDAIAASLRIDDGDPRIRWQYGQLETKGETGVAVKIELL